MLDKLHKREALEISGGGFGNGKYIPLSADDCQKKDETTLQDRPFSSDIYELEEKSHEESPDSVVNLSDSSPKVKAAVVGIRKSDIKKLKLASAAKSGVSLGNIHQPIFSLGMTQEGIGDVTPKVFVMEKRLTLVVSIN
ncbi:hypothetical protein R6Q59_028046 [Mikania micrantha]